MHGVVAHAILCVTSSTPPSSTVTSQLLAFLTQITAVWPPRIIVFFIVSPRIVVIVYIAIRIIAKRIIVLLICMQTKIENEHVCVSASLKVAMLQFFQICRKSQRQGEELL